MTNALQFHPKEVSCIFKAATGYTDTKPIIYAESNTNKVICQLPDQDGDYIGVQVKIRDEFSHENLSNIFDQKYKIASISSEKQILVVYIECNNIFYLALTPTYIEQGEITIGNDVEYASVLMGYLFSALNKNVTVQCIINGFGVGQTNITVNVTRDPYELRRVKCPLEITPDHPGRNLNVHINFYLF